MMIIDASADALYRSAGSGAWRGRAFWLCLVHRFVNSCTDPQTSEWYNYFKNDVPVHKMYGSRMYRLPGSEKTSGSEGSFRGKI